MPSNNWILPRPAESAIFRALPEGGVLFSTESEVYFGVNMVGARIWELMPPATQTFGELIDALRSEYSDVSVDVIRGDATKFVEQLLSNGLVVSRLPEDVASDARRP
ncbi:MAG: PqqD family protein [Gemmatimonadota bacterium]